VLRGEIEIIQRGAAATDAKRRPGFQTWSPRPAHGGQAIRSQSCRIRVIRSSRWKHARGRCALRIRSWI